MKTPEPIGEPIPLIPPRFNKTVFSQFFRHPNGTEYEFITFGYPRPESAVIVFPLTCDSRVVAIRQYRHGSRTVLLELPGGLKRTSESLEDIAAKELLEETGFHAKKLVRLNPRPIIIDPCNYAIPFDAILAKECEQIAEPDLEETEFCETVLIPFVEWSRMIDVGTITDSKSIVVTHFVRQHFLARP